MSYDRYSKFRGDGHIDVVPFIEIPVRSTDYYMKYKKGKDRLDIVSYNYYGDSNYDWLILQANPQYGAIEFEIPDDVTLRIPYPLNLVIEKYNEDIAYYKERYNI